MAELPEEIMAMDCRVTIKLLLVAMYSMTKYSDREKPFVCRSISYLSKKTNLSRTTVTNAIREAKALGLMRRESRILGESKVSGYAICSYDESGNVYRFEGRPSPPPGTMESTSRDPIVHQPVLAVLAPCNNQSPVSGTLYTILTSKLTANKPPAARKRDTDSADFNYVDISVMKKSKKQVDSEPDEENHNETPREAPSLDGVRLLGEGSGAGMEETKEPAQSTSEPHEELALFPDHLALNTTKPNAKRKPVSDVTFSKLLKAQNAARGIMAEKLGKTITGLKPRAASRQAIERRLAEGLTVDDLLDAAEIRGKLQPTDKSFLFAGGASFWSIKAIDYALAQADAVTKEGQSADGVVSEADCNIIVL